MARDLAVPPGPQSKNHTLDDCIRNPLCRDVLSVGHRGTIVWGPENTIPAFETALAMGADAVEMDVQETKDGELILMHDATLDRTTDCRGEVAQKSWAEIKVCKVIPLLPGIESASIPTFYEALNALRGRTVIEVDVKTPLSAAKVASEISQAGMTNQVMVLTGSIVAANFTRLRASLSWRKQIATATSWSFSGCPASQWRSKLTSSYCLRCKTGCIELAPVSLWMPLRRVT